MLGRRANADADADADAVFYSPHRVKGASRKRMRLTVWRTHVTAGAPAAVPPGEEADPEDRGPSWAWLEPWPCCGLVESPPAGREDDDTSPGAGNGAAGAATCGTHTVSVSTASGACRVMTASGPPGPFHSYGGAETRTPKACPSDSVTDKDDDETASASPADPTAVAAAVATSISRLSPTNCTRAGCAAACCQLVPS